jgi:hypothetical protein
VVVVDGDIDLLPATATVPMPWSICTVVAPVTFQIRVADSPAIIADGDASKLTMLTLSMLVSSLVSCGIIAKGLHATANSSSIITGIIFFIAIPPCVSSSHFEYKKCM